jgi:hypothetical protein
MLSRKPLSAALATVGLVLMSGGVAVAYDANAPVMTQDQVITIPQGTWLILTGVLVPLVVKLLTKASANAKVKVIANLAISAIAALVATATVRDGVAVLSQHAVIDIGLTYIAAVASYAGFWKHFEWINKILFPKAGLG